MTLYRTADDQKRAAAEAAVAHVRAGMKLGLGTGSTAEHFVRALGARADLAKTLACAATSERTAELARSLGLRVAPLDALAPLELTVDGADELDARLRLIKGGGGAHLREKIVAAASREILVIADASKKVETLGRFPLPVEISDFAPRTTMARLTMAAQEAGCAGHTIALRGGEAPMRSDGGNLIADLACGAIPDPEGLAQRLAAIPGVIEHGLFIGLARRALVGHPGGVETLEAE